MELPWKNPTELEKEMFGGYLAERDAKVDGVLYIQNIRHKLAAAVEQLGDSATGTTQALEDLYGIKLSVDTTGTGVLPIYTVTDEQKYMFFLMKF